MRSPPRTIVAASAALRYVALLVGCVVQVRGKTQRDTAMGILLNRAEMSVVTRSVIKSLFLQK